MKTGENILENKNNKTAKKIINESESLADNLMTVDSNETKIKEEKNESKGYGIKYIFRKT